MCLERLHCYGVFSVLRNIGKEMLAMPLEAVLKAGCRVINAWAL